MITIIHKYGCQVKSVGQSELVFGVYLSFERERGTLESLVAAEERVKARRDQLKRRAEKERQKDLDVVRDDVLCVCRWIRSG